MRRIYTILHLYLIVAIRLHLLWLISKTTKRPTTSEFLQLFRTSAKFLQSAFFAILYQAFRDAPHSLCLAVAPLSASRLTIRMTNLLILRSLSQAEKRHFIWRIAVNHEKQAPSVRQQQLLDGASARDDVGDVLVWIGTRPSFCGSGVRWRLFLRSALSNWHQVAADKIHRTGRP